MNEKNRQQEGIISFTNSFLFTSSQYMWMWSVVCKLKHNRSSYALCLLLTCELLVVFGFPGGIQTC